MNRTVHSLTSPSQLNDGKTYNDLPQVFAGTLEQCHDYCKMFAGYEWRKDESIFGGYYAHVESGDCLIIL